MSGIRHLLLTATAIASLACGRGTNLPAAQGDSVPLTVISTTPYSAYTEPQRVVLRTPEAWSGAWATIWAGAVPQPPLPDVDFEREVVVLAAAGVYPQRGPSITMPSAALAAGAVRVTVLEVAPGSECVVAPVQSSPVVAARMPHFDGEIGFADVRTVHSCGP